MVFALVGTIGDLYKLQIGKICLTAYFWKNISKIACGWNNLVEDQEVTIFKDFAIPLNFFA